MADVDMNAAPEVVVAKKAEPDFSANNSTVATRYTDAAAIANAVLREVLAALVAGANIADLCTLGDQRIEEEVQKICKKSKDASGNLLKKGIAFPTCISVNECVGHFSPLRSDTTVPVLADGDVVKVDLGTHVDGFVALVAQTVVIGATDAAPVTGVKADVIAAAYAAAEVALRLIKPGAKNVEVTAAIEKVAAVYGVKPILAMQAQEVKQWTIEAPKTIPLKKDPELGKYVECEFAKGEVYAVDIAMTSGEGKPKEKAARTTVFKLNTEVKVKMRMAASQKLMAELRERFPSLPFSLRACEEERSARLGLTEMLKNGVVKEYPVLFEPVGSAVAHVRFTAMLMEGGTLKLTGLEMPSYVHTDKALPADLAALRAGPSYVRKAKKTEDVAMAP